MSEEIKKEIFSRFKEFLNSKEGKELAAKKNKVGGRIRTYKTRLEKGNLTAKGALGLLIDLDLVDKIKFK